jgi:outer membrane protein OmpA-like peptidoglycan-associated protein
MKRLIALAAIATITGHPAVAGYRIENGTVLEMPLRPPTVVAAPVVMAPAPATTATQDKIKEQTATQDKIKEQQVNRVLYEQEVTRIKTLEAENAQLRARLLEVERQLSNEKLSEQSSTPCQVKGKTFGFTSGSTKLKHRISRKAEILERARAASSIEIVGYTDNTGSTAINKRIALARAKFVKEMLVKNGISPDIISISEKAGVYCATNDTIEGRAANRRAIVRFV